MNVDGLHLSGTDARWPDGPIRWWCGRDPSPSIRTVDRSPSRFGLPGGLALAGVFGGALVLAALAYETAGVAALAALVVVGTSSVVVVRRLNDADAAVERSTREVEEAGSRLQVLIEHVPAAVYIDMADPDVSDGGRLAYMSPQICGILGFRPDEFVDDPELWPSRIHPEDREMAIAAYGQHWETGEPLRAEYRMIARDGTEIWVRDEAYAMPDDESGRRMSQGLLIDTTDRKRLESKLIHDALHDPLTGVANRVLMRDHLERALVRRDLTPGMTALLFIDLDDFKRVNDELGHQRGDLLLQDVADQLTDAVRVHDIVVRQGGDEFAVIAPETNVDDARQLAERLRSRVASLSADGVPVGASIGCSHHPEDADTLEGLLGVADERLRVAKGDSLPRYRRRERSVPPQSLIGPGASE